MGRPVACELAARHGALSQHAHQLEPPGDHLAVVELGEGRKARSLGDDEAQQQLALGAQHFLLEQGKGEIENVSGLDVGIARGLADPIQDRRHGAAHQRLEQRLLVIEVEVERALGNAGPRCHVVEASGVVAPLGEDGERRVQDRLAPGGGVDFS